MASAKIFKGANRVEDESLVGRSITSILSDEVLVEALGLTDLDQFRVNGLQASVSYEIKEGDSVEFYKEQGRKGECQLID